MCVRAHRREARRGEELVGGQFLRELPSATVFFFTDCLAVSPAEKEWRWTVVSCALSCTRVLIAPPFFTNLSDAKGVGKVVEAPLRGSRTSLFLFLSLYRFVHQHSNRFKYEKVSLTVFFFCVVSYRCLTQLHAEYMQRVCVKHQRGTSRRLLLFRGVSSRRGGGRTWHKQKATTSESGQSGGVLCNASGELYVSTSFKTSAATILTSAH